MKKVAMAILGLLVMVSVVAAAPVSEQRMTAFGELQWTAGSVCEHPKAGGYLQYYLILDDSARGRELFLSGAFSKGMVGSKISVEGTLISIDRCLILEVDKIKLLDEPKQSDRFEATAW